MSTTRESYNKLLSLRNNLLSIAQNSVSEVKGDFAIIQKDQLKQGVSATGGSFRKYQNKAYAIKKNKMNPLPGLGNPDLKYTGSFYDGIFVNVSGDKITIGSHDEKAQMLEANYKNVFGLSPQEMEDFLYGKLRPVYRQNIIDFLNK
jgi:hypothetical protein